MLSSSVMRVVDANANRAREALRVVEDYARFVLDDDRLCGELKSLRHGLREALGRWVGEAILHRDTPGDVGTDNKTTTELTREDMGHVVTAAGKRLGEALRVLEEFLKTEDAQAAQNVETIRYRFYNLEQRVARTLGRGERFAGVRLYVLVTEKLCSGPWLQVAEAAIHGGADCVQLREKELEGGELLARARKLVKLCRTHGAISIINDRADVAMLSGADGVHVGQEDLPATEARRIMGGEMIVGVSTHSMEQAKQAAMDGADYIGVGPVFPSDTKPREILPGLGYAREAAVGIKIPAVAIAGITVGNVDEVLATGIKAVAVSSAVISAKDPRKAAEEMKRKLVKATDVG